MLSVTNTYQLNYINRLMHWSIIAFFLFWCFDFVDFVTVPFMDEAYSLNEKCVGFFFLRQRRKHIYLGT